MKLNLNFSRINYRRWLQPVSALLCGFALCALVVFTLLPTRGHAFAQGNPQQTAAVASFPEFPEGPGKAEFVRTCGKCHSPDNVLALNQNRAGWQDTISKMAGYGAEASDDDFLAILNYLEKNFPPVGTGTLNANIATTPQWTAQAALTQAEGDAIVAYRAAHGTFKSLDDLKKVPGVDPKKLDAAATRITFS